MFMRTVAVAVAVITMALFSAVDGFRQPYASIPRGYRKFHFDSQSQLCMSDGSTNSEPSLWKERIQYVDLSAVKESTSPDARELPLFLLGGAFYPEGTTYLNVFEMKYRTMMFDVAQKDDTFGYIHTDPQTGAIATVGTLCKITDRQLLDDGRQYISLRGEGRFRVNKILKTLPYVMAEVEPFDADDDVSEAVVAPLEQKVYSYLKLYIRLLRSADGNMKMVISQATKRHRPITNATAGNVLTGASAVEQSTRRTAFSFSLANMIQMQQPRESQLMLQTTSITKRLREQESILSQAAKLIGEQLVKMGRLSEEAREAMQQQSFSDDDDDSDILPDDYEEIEEEQEIDEWDINNIE